MPRLTKAPGHVSTTNWRKRQDLLETCTEMQRIEKEISLTRRLKINTFEHELISMEGVEDDVMCMRQEIYKWRRKVEDLKSKKTELVREMHGALKEKYDKIAKLREQSAALIQHIDNLENRLGEVGCTGKKLADLGSRQTCRKQGA